MWHGKLFTSIINEVNTMEAMLDGIIKKCEKLKKLKFEFKIQRVNWNCVKIDVIMIKFPFI
jgi:hypothetical protein